MFCHNCGTEIPDGLKVCPKCGASTGITQQCFCKKCGATINPGEDFCSSCGTYTEKKKEEIETNQSISYGFATLGFVVPIVGFILAATYSKSNPKAAKVILIASIIGAVIEASVFLPSLFTYML